MCGAVLAEMFRRKRLDVLRSSIVEAAEVNFLRSKFEGIRVAAVIGSSQNWFGVLLI
jgi:hypothetical protein